MVFPCLCTAVEVAVVRQGAGEWAVRVRPTGDRPAPPVSFWKTYLRGKADNILKKQLVI